MFWADRAEIERQRTADWRTAWSAYYGMAAFGKPNFRAVDLYEELQPTDVSRVGKRKTRAELEEQVRETYAAPGIDEFVKRAFGEDAQLAPLADVFSPPTED